ncbi:putative phosphatase 2C beta [Fasciola hepatica]|uniref:Phosphatase 2C beta n=1 Tax=Fasciola hepatica TaxID=6192 RepID=A0A4E0RNX4_FASHE|nr:putative phosphatase 2C beta [Fasciola hepatica]
MGDYAYNAVECLGPNEHRKSPETETTVPSRNKELDETIVLACDDIWDVLSNEALCSLLQHRMRYTDDLSLVCNETINICLYKGSSDNVSIVLVTFDPAPRTDPKCKSEDEKVQEVLFERAKNYLETTREQLLMESFLAHLRTFPEPRTPSFLVFCRGGKVQKLSDGFTSPNQPNGG